MAEICVLQPHIANLIAAGEVVERPLSVVKELIENAIDAEATTITVEIARGGLDFIRVTDNGKSIPPSQVETAFLRHATSKLQTAKQLATIDTLGFRGEALAAICAVSKIEITARCQGDTFGTYLEIEGGNPKQAEQTGAALGTTIIVRDLFYNTPARLKFMKPDRTEGAAVYAVVQQLALSQPHLAIQFIRDQKLELNTARDATLKTVMADVFGREIAKNMVEISYQNNKTELNGYISTPTACRGSRNYQHFYVNGRYIKSPLLSKALETAYENRKMVGKFPAGVIHLTLPPERVDINVHPAKTQVKFANEKEIFGLVLAGVGAALEQDNTIQQVELKENTPSTIENPKPLLAPPPKQIRTTLHDFGYRPIEQTPPVMSQSGLWAKKSEIPPQAQPVNLKFERISHETILPTHQVEEKPIQSSVSIGDIRENATKSSENPRNEVIVLEQEEEQIPIQAQEEIEPWRLIGEFFQTYIIVEQGERVVMIDKHAAHERINFERLRAEGYTPMSQTLMIPSTLHPTPQEFETLLEHQKLLEQFGFELESFGQGSVIVRQIPFDIDEGEIEQTLLDIAKKLQLTPSIEIEQARDHVIHSIACQAAIKSGYQTGERELNHLAEQVLSQKVKFCPHGRPVAIELTKAELEKKFKRS